MRKFVSLYLLLLAFLICACSTEEEISYITINEVRLNILPIGDKTILDGDDGDDEDSLATRSAMTFENSNYFKWFENNDTVGIFPEGGYQIPFVIEMEEGERKESVAFSAKGWRTKEGINYVPYFPFDFYNRYYDKVPFSFLGQKQQYTPGEDYDMGHMGKYMLLVSTPVTPTENGTFIANMNMQGCYLRFRLTLPEGTPDLTFKKMTVASSKADQFIVEGTIDLFSSNLQFTPTKTSSVYEIPLEDMHINAKRRLFIYMMMGAPIVLTGSTLTVYLYSEEGYTYTGSISYSTNAQIGKNSYGNINLDLTLQTSPNGVYLNEYDNSGNGEGVAIE